MCRLLRLTLIRFPGRRFIFVGDGGYGTRQVAQFCHRHGGRLTPVSELCPDANLHAPPPPYAGKGRPRVKGRRLAKPRQAVGWLAPRSRSRLTVAWYGGGTRRVGVLTCTGHWYTAGRGSVPIRWVFVSDLSGSHRDEYLLTTDPGLRPAEVIGLYTARWNIETTFQECRSELGLETTRGWCRNTVLRAAPGLFGLYSIVALLYQTLPAVKRAGSVSWPGKSGLTFSDAPCAVRRWRWAEGVFPQAGDGSAVEKLPGPLRELLLPALAPAA
jgi:hypothetical protein